MNTRNKEQGSFSLLAGEVAWFVTTQTAPWQARTELMPQTRPGPADVMVQTERPRQTIEGFGACFNELGWTALAALEAEERDGILRELFAPGVGAQFTLCRMSRRQAGPATRTSLRSPTRMGASQWSCRTTCAKRCPSACGSASG
jgi:O-glycosyl hydrolase